MPDRREKVPFALVQVNHLTYGPKSSQILNEHLEGCPVPRHRAPVAIQPHQVDPPGGTHAREELVAPAKNGARLASQLSVGLELLVLPFDRANVPHSDDTSDIDAQEIWVMEIKPPGLCDLEQNPRRLRNQPHNAGSLIKVADEVMFEPRLKAQMLANGD